MKSLPTIMLRAILMVGMISSLAQFPNTAKAQQRTRFTSDWSFRTGALFLDGGGNLPNTLLLARGNLFPVLFGNAIDTGVGTGWETELSKQLNDDWYFDTRYFKLDSLGDTLTASNLVNGAGVRYSNTVSGVLGAVTGSYELTYGADLESVELLARRRLNEWLQISAGVRYLRFDDNMIVTIRGANFSSTSSLFASNEMTGAQLGGNLLLLELDRFSILTSGAAGIYHNDIDAALRLRNNSTRSSSIEDTRTSFAGEVELKGRYQLSKHIYAEAGYRLLFLEDIALATEQAIINPAPGSGAMTAIDSSDNRMLQGATASLVFLF